MTLLKYFGVIFFGFIQALDLTDISLSKHVKPSKSQTFLALTFVEPGFHEIVFYIGLPTDRLPEITAHSEKFAEITSTHYGTKRDPVILKEFLNVILDFCRDMPAKQVLCKHGYHPVYTDAIFSVLEPNGRRKSISGHIDPAFNKSFGDFIELLPNISQGVKSVLPRVLSDLCPMNVLMRSKELDILPISFRTERLFVTGSLSFEQAIVMREYQKFTESLGTQTDGVFITYLSRQLVAEAYKRMGHNLDSVLEFTHTIEQYAAEEGIEPVPIFQQIAKGLARQGRYAHIF